MKAKRHGIFRVLRYVCLSCVIALGLISILGTAHDDDDETTYNISEYSPMAEGDTWQYNYGGTSTRTVTVSGTEAAGGVQAKKLVDGDGGYELWTNSSGLVLYKRMWLEEGSEFSEIYSGGITIFPAAVSVGTVQDSTTNYAVTAPDGTYTGTATVKAEVLGLEDKTVVAGTFQNSLKVKMTYSLSFTVFGRAISITQEDTIWKAKDVGDVAGISTRTTSTGIFTDTYQLMSATVGGVSYP